MRNKHVNDILQFNLLDYAFLKYASKDVFCREVPNSNISAFFARKVWLFIIVSVKILSQNREMQTSQIWETIRDVTMTSSYFWKQYFSLKKMNKYNYGDITININITIILNRSNNSVFLLRKSFEAGSLWSHLRLSNLNEARLITRLLLQNVRFNISKYLLGCKP